MSARDEATHAVLTNLSERMPRSFRDVAARADLGIADVVPIVVDLVRQGRASIHSRGILAMPAPFIHVPEFVPSAPPAAAPSGASSQSGLASFRGRRF